MTGVGHEVPGIGFANFGTIVLEEFYDFPSLRNF